ncbi:4a-hydroxytetrahydrobiopterin dehydratase [Croceitalea rosinachiae]|uniref:Putative pterin-4-alpha-carbinolamine dehydratase n=1 Tax=Croceitalea rosinachiae TaxID=3075596 RepID=A0ABU3AE71_9FLAO|nr:4a-hydroxytetrahydrobiopterin dehydratase [Croceitalea sp. F388]MDT0608486.1 4a-hydroxytetrahydrobiopterin dehydratase [Croceitalea sp. F388]
MKKLHEIQIIGQLKNIEGWDYKNGYLYKSYKFKNFKETFSVMTRIAFECEAQNHHPEWENVYNSLTIKLNTHDVGGITQNDFDLAIAIESIVNSQS